MATSISLGDLPDWSEAWSQVQMAIRQFGAYRADKALESLPELTREATKRIGFTNLCMSENPSSDRANFRMIYETLADRKKKDAQISAPLRNLISQMSETLFIEEGKE